jgi:hypothetical protein
LRDFDSWKKGIMPDSAKSGAAAVKSYVWLLFAGFGVLFVIYGIYAFTLQHLQPEHWQWLSIKREAVDYIGGTFRWLGMVSIGFGVHTVLVSYGGFRQGDKWTWYAFWLYPVFFLIAIPVTWPGLMCLPFAVVSIAALWVARPAANRMK